MSSPSGKICAHAQSNGSGQPKRAFNRLLLKALSATVVLVLTACGGGGGGGNSNSPPPTNSSGSSASSTIAVAPPSPTEASRFFSQATFGATDADINALTSSSYGTWLDGQLAMAPTASHLTWMDQRLAALRATNPSANVSANQFYESFWMQAATGNDQLRQRIKLALSEIFVTSFTGTAATPRAMASYYDMLGRDAFGNFRTLLQDVTYHPAMGLYLTYMGNQKEEAKTGRNPDENYAREVMQLMTIGLWELNTDGTRKTDLFGNNMPTYTTDDVKGLAKVFTGLSWYSPAPSNTTFWGGSKDAEAYTTPMTMYNSVHSLSEKAFLGTTIPASSVGDGNKEINQALDTLFNHPNVGPFICKQLIQRLITSNPSSAYVKRCAQIFNNNGSQTRGDMAAVIKSILTDSEARTTSTDISYGKIREPVVRFGNWLRSFGATSTSGTWLMTSTSAQSALNQAPLTAGSVFNFYRPGYIPANSIVGNKGKVAPEMQITDEVSGAAYLNIMQTAIEKGIGSNSDVQASYARELVLANNPTALVDRVDLLLGIGMSSTLKGRIVQAVTDISIPAAGSAQTNIDTANLNRVRLAIFLAMASPEYLAQR